MRRDKSTNKAQTTLSIVFSLTYYLEFKNAISSMLLLLSPILSH